MQTRRFSPRSLGATVVASARRYLFTLGMVPSLFLVEACATEPSLVGSSSAAVGSGSKFPPLEFNQNTVQFYDYSNFGSATGPSGNVLSFHIDAAVQNLAYVKQVGIVWSPNGWTDVLTCNLGYEQALDEGFEKWGADCNTGSGTLSFSATQPVATFAVFATQNGSTVWDNNDRANYVIGKSPSGAFYPSPLHGVQVTGQLLAGSDAAPDAVAIGTALVWPYAGSKSVSIVYSTGTSTTTSPLTANADGSYSWSIPASGGTTFRYSVNYVVKGVTFTADDGGTDYVLPIPPPNVTGSYEASCSGCSATSSELTCDACADGSGAEHGASLPLPCTQDIANCEGVLRCGGCSTIGVLPDGTVDQAIVDCYNQLGGVSAIGSPVDTGGGLSVYRLKNGNVQDFAGSSTYVVNALYGETYGGVKCMHEDGQSQAFSVHAPVLGEYLISLGNSFTFWGYPIANTNYYYAAGGGTIVYQNFENGYYADDNFFNGQHR